MPVVDGILELSFLGEIDDVETQFGLHWDDVFSRAVDADST